MQLAESNSNKQLAALSQRANIQSALISETQRKNTILTYVSIGISILACCGGGVAGAAVMYWLSNM